jgi:RNA polymerase sigma-70 factor
MSTRSRHIELKSAICAAARPSATTSARRRNEDGAVSVIVMAIDGGRWYHLPLTVLSNSWCLQLCWTRAAFVVQSSGVQLDPSTVARLHAVSGGAAWGVSPEALAEAIRASVAHRFTSAPDRDELDVYLASLNVADLALATACRAGHDGAWEHFIRELRPALYAAGRMIAGDDGREIADSLYAELFGLQSPDGSRRSLLAYYHGRSRLITWLRSVLVQRTIDRRRQSVRLTSLDESSAESPAQAHAGVTATLVAPADPDPDRERLVACAQSALDAAIDALEPRDRIRLRLYYGQDLTLARIGRLLGESEATVSRRLDRARRQLREAAAEALSRTHGLSPPAVARAFEYAAGAPELQLDRLLSGAEDT